MNNLLPAFFDELEKIGVSYHTSSFQQTRVGRRPIRVHRMLEKESVIDKPDVSVRDRERPPQDSIEYEGGSGMGDAQGMY